MRSLGQLQLGVAAVSFLLAIRLDALLIRFIHTHVSSPIGRAFGLASELASAEGAVLVGLSLYAIGHVQRWRHQPGTRSDQTGRKLVRAGKLLLLTLSSGALIVLALKLGVARARPQLLIDYGFNGFGTPFAGSPFNSFPSSHAFTAFALAAVARHTVPALALPALIVAATISACRVIALEHYLTDIVFSAMIAFVCGQFWCSRSGDVHTQKPWMGKRLFTVSRR